jgi:hypothetical protein
MISVFYSITEGNASKVGATLERLAMADKGTQDYSPEIMRIGAITSKKLLENVYAVLATSVSHFPQRPKENGFMIIGKDIESVFETASYLEDKPQLTLRQSGRNMKQ